jgi:hypothetical protein
VEHTDTLQSGGEPMDEINDRTRVRQPGVWSRVSRFFDPIGLIFWGSIVAVLVFAAVTAAAKEGESTLFTLFHVAFVLFGIAAVCAFVLGIIWGIALALDFAASVAKWAWQQLGSQVQEWVIKALILAIGCIVMAAIYQYWEVPEIGDRPISSLTLSELAQNILKNGVLFMIGLGLLRIFSD